MQLIECVPNISEGNDDNIIKTICDEIEKVDKVKLLNVDPGKATNRTVITFIGSPKQVIKAAFLLIKKAQELIDMSKHKGEHPRMGAVDVCPLIPIANISMEETIKLAHELSEKVGNELKIPVYCYESAAKLKERKNLANCRSGEYEGLEEKLKDDKWKPDYGPSEFNEQIRKSGATAIAARDFLIAYNVNLNTTSTRRANAIAFDLREAGRLKREGNKLTGKVEKDKEGKPIRIPGFFKNLKGIGWFIKEYGIAQISYNITNIQTTPLHIVFEKTCKRAEERGIRVTGSELVGLIPKKVLIDAGLYFLKKQQRSSALPENEIIRIAIKTLGLDELKPFNTKEQILENYLESNSSDLINMSLNDFAYETASESPAPGGGSIAAYCGTLGAALATMSANLSAHKRGWDDKWETFSNWGNISINHQKNLLNLVDKDAQSFNNIMDAFKLPNSNEEEKINRFKAIQLATKKAIEIPLEVMETSFKSFEVIRKMAEIGNPNAITDVGVAALCARAAVVGAYLNLKINCKSLDDKIYVKKVIKKGMEMVEKANSYESEILEIVNNEL
jgi:glutamate formiminotransferase/formiminotetrahydrofolate cyclodeaminase